MTPDHLAAFAAGLLVGFFLATFWCRVFVTKRFEEGDLYHKPATTRSQMIEGLGGESRIKLVSQMCMNCEGWVAFVPEEKTTCTCEHPKFYSIGGQP